MRARCRLLAGSYGPERVPVRPDPEGTDWYLPLHLREPQRARARVAAQVEAGADVVVAPTWLTHRRALLPLGETRRAAEWSAGAVRLAREAVELGLERRESALAEAATPEAPVRRDRPAPLVAATLPALDDEASVSSGRLLPQEAANERDYRDQAGHLADAEPDLILVEGQHTESDARIAISEAVGTGVPTWAALSTAALAASDVEGWLEWAGANGVARVLLAGRPAEHGPSVDAPLPWGGLAREPEQVQAWLELGADAIALLDGASAPVVERLREAIDGHERLVIEAEASAEGRWWSLVERAAAMAPGGAAVWLGHAPQRSLPEGFDWLVLEATQVGRLPADRFRLAVVTPDADAHAVLPSLERGALLVGPLTLAGMLRPLVLDEATEPSVAILRRED